MSPESVQWNPSFETELGRIDQEHQSLVAQLNQMIELLTAGADTARWLPILDQLINEVTAHFAHEEQVMENIGYPGYPAHRQQHQQLLQEVAEFRRGVTAGHSGQDAIDTIRFVKFWVLKHMIQEDLKIKKYVYRGLPPQE